MTFWEVVLVSSITFSVIMGFIILIYTYITAKNMRKQQNRMPELFEGLKPGVQVLFAGGFLGTFVSKNETFAIVKLKDNTEVEVALYSISNIIT